MAPELAKSPQVAALQGWAEAAYADLTLMDALHGEPLAAQQSVAELLPHVVEPRRLGDVMETFLIRFASESGGSACKHQLRILLV